jgi:hypothetical protein
MDFRRDARLVGGTKSDLSRAHAKSRAAFTPIASTEVPSEIRPRQVAARLPLSRIPPPSALAFAVVASRDAPKREILVQVWPM